ncbi:hypothetical protein DU80_17120 [Methanosarcina mazei]|uniref:Uncharacterized protein n=2 Tax=Methanosarcina mazei TaxID=2209 RepID=A0A0F8SFG3_METMZ|nr:hypothetical protein DU40_11530 [Methanosarcina mazei]KKG02476.1 hypothetical protein DU31_05335 [Methanosarcina mazei]KKG03256.1 hypothetical protein DU47_17135 [Methanosarcina mazei]KKG07556.1 hypothetical protein DU34_15130 [Methanosarcina mazei]KKG36786.1 hypothetical protein DU30_05010 [Methanosarcina mazei]
MGARCQQKRLSGILASILTAQKGAEKQGNRSVGETIRLLPYQEDDLKNCLKMPRKSFSYRISRI